jgi:sporulation protein YlmC with PRC-barrel domain
MKGKRMDIPVNAEVKCSDGPAGHSTSVILNPITPRVTHIVVEQKGFLHMERLVPVDLVTASTPHEIQLRCTLQELADMEAFIDVQFIPPENPYMAYEPGEYMLWPYVHAEEDVMLPIEMERIPPGELSIHRGAHVEAKDGRVGTVDEFLVDLSDGHISHLVLREGHLWGQKDVTIPVSEIERIEEDTVYLKLNRHSVEKLPGIPVKRWYEGLLSQ